MTILHRLRLLFEMYWAQGLSTTSLDPFMAVPGGSIVCQGLERLLPLLEERTRL